MRQNKAVQHVGRCHEIPVFMCNLNVNVHCSDPHMHMQVVLCTGGSTQRAQAAEAAEAARAAAETHASLAAQRSGSGTGEMLRSNFVVVADLVLEQDGHLLSPEEHTITAAFKASYACLNCVYSQGTKLMSTRV